MKSTNCKAPIAADLRHDGFSGINGTEMAPGFYITTCLMGYGHLRAADNVAGLGRGQLIRVDRPPFASPSDAWILNAVQRLYHGVSRTAETRLRFLFRIMEKVEDIPEDSRRASLEYSRLAHFLLRMGVGGGLRRLGGSPRLHTFFLPGLACVYNRYPGKNYQLLCDADFHRVWAPIKPNEGDVTYLAPTEAGADRLLSYGVERERILVTGFPLPLANTGDRGLSVLQSDLRARLTRLAPRSDSPLRLVFALSGAGCYLKVLSAVIRELLPRLRDGRLALTVAVGDNLKAKKAVERWAGYHNAECRLPNADCPTEEERRKLTVCSGRLSLIRPSTLPFGNRHSAFGISILYSPDLLQAFSLFNQALRESDLLITKPGELVFYAALGIPQILLPPIGKHEVKNRAYLMKNGAAEDFPGPVSLATWLAARRADGTWLRAAESAFARLPKLGTFEINDLIRP